MGFSLGLLGSDICYDLWDGVESESESESEIYKLLQLHTEYLHDTE